MVEQLRAVRRRHGHQVFAVVSGERGSLVDKLAAEGIPHFAADFRFASLRDLWSLPGKIVALAWFFRRQRFDVVHTHLFHSMVIGRFAAWLADVPVRLAMVAGPFHLEAETPRWIDRSTCWMETALIASCEHTRDLYRGLGIADDRIELAYYGPDPAGFDPARTIPAPIRGENGWPPDTPLIAMVAYFYPRFGPSHWTPRPLWGRATKGHEYLIRAMPLVLRELPQARCVLVGSGWEEGGAQQMEEMKELVHALGLEHAVVFTGFRSDIAAILRTASVSVQPSLSENLGGTIESLLMACPTVASRVGGMTDSVRDGETGVLVAPADPEDLTRGIIALLTDPGRARELARRGRELMLARFCLDRTAHDLDEIYLRRRAQSRQRGYRAWVSLLRLLVAMPVAAYLAARLTFAEFLWRARQHAGFPRRPKKVRP